MIQVFDGDGVEHRYFPLVFGFLPEHINVETKHGERSLLMRFKLFDETDRARMVRIIGEMQDTCTDKRHCLIQLHKGEARETYGRILSLRHAFGEGKASDDLELWIKMTVEDTDVPF